jgi:pilus assembly protein Flp/PilA
MRENANRFCSSSAMWTRARRKRSSALQTFLLRFLRNSSGTTAIEYALIACGIAVAIVTIVGQIGVSVSAKYQTVSNALK